MNILASFRQKYKEENICLSTLIMNVCKSDTLKERLYYGQYYIEYKEEKNHLTEEEKMILVRIFGYRYSYFDMKEDEPEICPIKEDEVQDYIQKGQTVDMCINLYEYLEEEKKRIFRPINMNCHISLIEKNEIMISADKGITYTPAFLKEILDVNFDSFNFQSLYINWENDSSEDNIEAYGICEDGWHTYNTTCSLYKGMTLHKYIYLSIGYYLIGPKNPYKNGNRLFYKNKNVYRYYTY